LLSPAPQLTGPWTEGQVLYKMPEMQPGLSHDKNVFCYAGKEHSELETGSDVVFSYMCNPTVVPELATKRASTPRRWRECRRHTERSWATC